MHRDALGDRESNRRCAVAVVGHNRRDSCLRRMGCFLLSTVLRVSRLNTSICGRTIRSIDIVRSVFSGIIHTLGCNGKRSPEAAAGLGPIGISRMPDGCGDA
jgi:hypothetical protein